MVLYMRSRTENLFLLSLIIYAILIIIAVCIPNMIATSIKNHDAARIYWRQVNQSLDAAFFSVTFALIFLFLFRFKDYSGFFYLSWAGMFIFISKILLWCISIPTFYVFRGENAYVTYINVTTLLNIVNASLMLWAFFLLLYGTLQIANLTEKLSKKSFYATIFSWIILVIPWWQTVTSTEDASYFAAVTPVTNWYLLSGHANYSVPSFELPLSIAAAVLSMTTFCLLGLASMVKGKIRYYLLVFAGALLILSSILFLIDLGMAGAQYNQNLIWGSSGQTSWSISFGVILSIILGLAILYKVLIRPIRQ